MGFITQGDDMNIWHKSWKQDAQEKLQGVSM